MSRPAPGVRLLEVEPFQPSDPAVRTAWRELQARGAVRSPFSSWEWFSAFTEVPEVSARVQVLLVRDGDRNLGLFPVEWADGPGGLRTVGPAGWRWLAPDHVDVVSSPDDGPAVARAIVRHLSSSTGWDACDLDGLTANGALARAAAERLRLPRFVPLAPQEIRVPFVRLRDDEAEVRRGVRRWVGRGLQVAERSGGGFSSVCEPGALVSLLEELMRLHNVRFGSASAVFATPARRRFHALAARRLAEAGMARMYRLAADGTDVGLNYVLVLGDRVFGYQLGMVPQKKWSVGRVVIGEAILAAADEGFREFDLLRGDEPWKGGIPSQARHDLRFRALRPTARAVAWSSGRLLQRLRRSGKPGE